MKHHHLFAKTDKDLGEAKIPGVELNTGDHPPVRQRAYRTPFSLRKEIDKQIDNMLSAGVIAESTGPWASPILLVGKKDGSQRFCDDYRKLNNILVKNSYPLPNTCIEDIFAALHGVR